MAIAIFLPALISFLTGRTRMPLKYVVALISLVTLSGASLLLFVRAPVGVVMMIFILISASGASTGPFINALAMQFENIGIHINYGIARGLGSAGYALIGFVTGHFVQMLGTDFIIPFYLCLSAIAVFCVFIFKRPVRPAESVPKTEPAVQLTQKASVWSVFKTPSAVCLFCAIICVSLNQGVLDTFQINILKGLGGTDADYGSLILVMAFSELPTMFLFKNLAKRFGYSRLLGAGFLFFAVKDIALLLAPNVAIVIGVQALNALSLGLYIPASVYLINSLAGGRNAVHAQAIFGGVASGLGRIVGNFAGGAIIDAYSTHAMMVFALVSILAGFVLLQFAVRLRKDRQQAVVPQAD